ncbi:FAD-dependent monooxygenase [Bradyrhizobium sp. 521_C7_N1_3]|uniref:FAD-dependent monooxygenase n=1 Tax=Bradyrhizobium TaxID=374 RepID=UPI002714E2B2|nr:FAD-dependent monooxygenase [Bradyrhizobium japonicum]WLB50466.1 FAD-dependent monooxygenase [Bradyrhizobium japonicum]WLB59260.1 FAD-dependent monooxygenase [Bradyrhizobium japonicum]
MIRNVLVVGGGIGGLTAAVALRRRGVAIDLVELSARWNIQGVGISQPNNALRALDRIGLAGPCIEHGAAYPGWRIYDSNGRHLLDAPSTNAAAPNCPPTNGISRPLLHEILLDAATTAGAEIRLGTTVETLENSGDKVNVTFWSGERRSYDFVVGADGIYSSVRQFLFGSGYQPSFTGQAVWRYKLSRPESVTWGELHFGPNSKVGLVPISPAVMYMFLITHEPGNPWMESDRLADLMRLRLSSYNGLIAQQRELITDPSCVNYKPMEEIWLPVPWGKGRIMLIGDAAHASTTHLAQGAAMAIEDAVLLGELLGRDAPLDALTAEFMARRFNRVKYVFETSAQIGAWELEKWQGIVNPDARPAQLLQAATVELMKDY